MDSYKLQLQSTYEHRVIIAKYLLKRLVSVLDHWHSAIKSNSHCSKFFRRQLKTTTRSELEKYLYFEESIDFFELINILLGEVNKLLKHFFQFVNVRDTINHENYNLQSGVVDILLEEQYFFAFTSKYSIVSYSNSIIAEK
ncbi:unnamed protein product [Orchesella dallaii]|uniref:Uncharacterized protein n=1 Tax=Orchesella dallaii TaxID=48710 RepID=A0ABP1QU00_9HEXA